MASPDNVLDFLLEFFGCAAEEDLTVVLPDADDVRLDALGRAYEGFAAASWKLIAPLPPGELRPFVETSSIYDVPAWARGGFDFGAQALQTVDTTFEVVDKIKHRLLYCHSVALDDPLWQFVSLAAAQYGLRRGQAAQGDSAAQALRHYANLLLHLKDLLRRQIVCPVYTPNLLGPAGHAARARRDALAADVDRVLDNDEVRGRLDFQALVDAAPAPQAAEMRRKLQAGASDQALLRDLFGRIARRRLAMALSAATESEGRTTLYLPFRDDVDALAQCVGAVDALRRATGLAGDQSYLLAPLLDLPVPGLAALTPEQIVGIRANADEFERWRTDLRQALLAAEAVPAGVLDRSSEMKRIVDDRMNASLAQLNASLPRSPFLRAARVGATALVGGTIGAAVTAALDPSGTATLVTMAIVLGQLATAGYSAVAELGEAAAGTPGATVAARNAHYLAVLR